MGFFKQMLEESHSSDQRLKKKKKIKKKKREKKMLKAQDWQKSFFKRKELGGGDELGEDCQAVEKFNKFHVTLKTVMCRVAQGQ